MMDDIRKMTYHEMTPSQRRAILLIAIAEMTAYFDKLSRLYPEFKDGAAEAEGD